MKQVLLILAGALGALFLNAGGGIPDQAAADVVAVDADSPQAAEGTVEARRVVSLSSVISDGLKGPRGDLGPKGPAGQDAPGALEVMGKLNVFYESAWSKLIWALGGGFAVVGTVISIVLALNFRSERAAIRIDREELEEKIDALESVLRNDIETDLAALKKVIVRADRARIKQSRSIEQDILASQHKLETKIEVAEQNLSSSEVNLKAQIDEAGSNASRNMNEISMRFETNLIEKAEKLDGLLLLVRAREFVNRLLWERAVGCFMQVLIHFIQGKQNELLRMVLREFLPSKESTGVLSHLISSDLTEKVLSRSHDLTDSLRSYESDDESDDESDNEWEDWADRIEQAFEEVQGRADHPVNEE